VGYPCLLNDVHYTWTAKIVSLKIINEIYKEAISCRDCSKSGCAYGGKADVYYPQPRPVGANYFDSSPKTLLVFVNPGSAGKKDLASANLLNNLSRDYQVGSADFSGVNKYLTGDMQTWGVKRSRKDQNYL
jgi:hypothetical protein